ncbi:MAG TPA: hypothetical protein VEG34_16010 [Thermoanaerobaculia bacterium]|nr:hypothetical protein [Thermoanaerobaculia bacterium]
MTSTVRPIGCPPGSIWRRNILSQALDVPFQTTTARPESAEAITGVKRG